MARTYVYIDMIQNIYGDDTYSPHIGLDSQDAAFTFVPWRWDERIWTDAVFENLDLSLPTLWDGNVAGLSTDYLQSGVGNKKIDLEILKIVKQRQESVDYWTPQIRHGAYYKYDKGRYFFANRSIIQHIDNADNEGTGIPTDRTRNVLQLTHVPRTGSPIKAIMWGRDSDDEPIAYRTIQKKVDFTGIWTSSGNLASTRGGTTNAIQWKWVDQSKKEFVTEWYSTYPKLIFNQDFTFLQGKATIASDDDLEYCEILGDSDGTTTQIFFTNLFPILDNSELTFYAGDYTTTWNRWIDLGAHAVTELDSAIPSYESQTGHKFRVNQVAADNGYYKIDLDRGEITFPSTAPTVGDRLFLRYRATAEVEYEPEYSPNYDIANEIQLNPLRNPLNQGFIYLTEQDMRVASVVLTAERELVTDETDVYGPLFIGTDYTFLVATAYNRHGLPIPGETITFYLPDYTADEELGRLAGIEGETTAITDGNGEARIVYTPPHSVEELGTYIEHSNLDDSKVLTIPSGVSIDTNADVFTYRVYSGESWQPWDSVDEKGGVKVVQYVWDATAIHPRTGLVGAYVPVKPTIISTTEITYAEDLPVTNYEAPGPDVDEGSGIADSVGIVSHVFTVGEPAGLKLETMWISAGKDVEVKAKVYSSLYDRDVESESLYLRLDVPTYLKGTYVAEGIGTIPYGFRLYDDYFTGASGLDGVTYLSINPAMGYWDVLWPNETTGLMAATGEVEDAEPFIDTGRYLWLNDVSHAFSGHMFFVRDTGATGHRFAVNGTQQGHQFSVYPI